MVKRIGGVELCMDEGNNLLILLKSTISVTPIVVKKVLARLHHF